MTLNTMLERLAKVMPLDECPDPHHNLRGVTTKGVQDGWLVRVDRGVYALADDDMKSEDLKSDAKKYDSSEPLPRTRARRRRTRKPLEIAVGNITLRTPSGMQPETLARLVQAIRGIN